MKWVGVLRRLVYKPKHFQKVYKTGKPGYLACIGQRPWLLSLGRITTRINPKPKALKPQALNTNTA